MKPSTPEKPYFSHYNISKSKNIVHFMNAASRRRQVVRKMCVVVLRLAHSVSVHMTGDSRVRASMRYAVLPPAFTRGVPPVRFPGGGGSPSITYLYTKRFEEQGCKHRKIMLFYALLSEIRTPPAPVCATFGTPLTSAGGKASNHPRSVGGVRRLTARVPELSIVHCQFL